MNTPETHTAADAAGPARRRRDLLVWGWMFLLSWALPLAAALPAASVRINEFLALPASGRADKEGRRPPWIELYNEGSATVNLAGCFLTDTPTNLTKWRFPQVALLPDSYLVIAAGGNGQTTPSGRLQAAISIQPRGGYLALVSPEARVLSEIRGYPAQQPNRSYGRLCGESAALGCFSHPTPGKPNSYRGPEFAPEIGFSSPGGGFAAPFALRFSWVPARMAIHYTLDGTLPTDTSPVYRQPLQITNTVEVRARAFAFGRHPGPPHSATFVLLNTNAQAFRSTLPVVVMQAMGRPAPAKPEDLRARFFFYEPIRGETALTNPPASTAAGGFHRRGSTSRGMDKGSFAVELWDEFDQNQAQAVLGMPAESDWVLYAVNGFEPVLIHQPFVHQLSRDMGRYSSRTRFVELFLANRVGPLTDAHYNGIYVLEEKIKIDKHRVAIAKLGPDDLILPEVSGGFLLKIDRPGPSERGFRAAGTTVLCVEPKEAVINLPQRAAQKEYLLGYFRDFDRALYGADWKSPETGYRAFVDVDAWIDYHVLELLSGSVDTLNFSTYFHKPREGKLAFGPHWDFDRALGSTDGRDADPRHWTTGPYFGHPWWSRLFHDPDFWQQWVDRWQELRRTHFSLANLWGLADRLAAEVREAQPREARRWGLRPRGGSYQAEVNLMKQWLSNRVDFIDQQLAAPPHFSQEGGLVKAGVALTLSGPRNGTIYYTLDGSDPRAAQGGISSNALPYTAPIVLKTETRIMARTHDPNRRQTGGPPISTPWSGPIAAHFKLVPH